MKFRKIWVQFFLNNKVATSNIFASCASGITEKKHKEIEWDRKEWHKRKNMDIGDINNKPLVEREKNIFPPLHIKLDLMKQFVKAVDKNGSFFAYISEKCFR